MVGPTSTGTSSPTTSPDLADRRKPTTVAFRYRSLQQLTKWLVAEGELTADPMAGMHVPHVPEQPVPVLTDDDLRALLAACKGTGFAERRDTAIIRSAGRDCLRSCAGRGAQDPPRCPSTNPRGFRTAGSEISASSRSRSPETSISAPAVRASAIK
jgi:hypothetical protein